MISPPSYPKPQVLIVDDKQIARQTIAQTLSKDGFDCTAAASVDAALQQVRAINPAVVVLDLQVSNGKGMSLLKQLRLDYPDTQVLILTAHCSTESAIQAVNYGAFSYLTKPVEPGELFVHVVHATETHRRFVAQRNYERMLEGRLEERLEERVRQLENVFDG